MKCEIYAKATTLYTFLWREHEWELKGLVLCLTQYEFIWLCFWVTDSLLVQLFGKRESSDKPLLYTAQWWLSLPLALARFTEGEKARKQAAVHDKPPYRCSKVLLVSALPDKTECQSVFAVGVSGHWLKLSFLWVSFLILNWAKRPPGRNGGLIGQRELTREAGGSTERKSLSPAADWTQAPGFGSQNISVSQEEKKGKTLINDLMVIWCSGCLRMVVCVD